MDLNASNASCSRGALDPNYKVFAIIVNGFLTTVMAIFGCIGNISSLLLLQSGQQSAKLGQLKLGSSLIALGVWDTILLLCSVAYYGLRYTALAFGVRDNFAYLTFIFHPIISIANTASAWFVVLISMQRFLASRDPFRRHFYFSSRSSMFRNDGRIPSCFENRKHLILPIGLSIGTVLVSFPTFMEIVVYECFDAKNVEFITKLRPTLLRVHPDYKIYYRVVVRSIFNSLGPLLLVLVLTAVTLKQLHAARRSRELLLRRTMSVKHRELVKQRSQTVMSVALITKFLLLRSLPSTLDIWEAVVGYNTRMQRQRFMYVVDISNLLVNINSATNWLVYHKGKEALEKQLSLRSKQRNARFRDIKNNMPRLQNSWNIIKTNKFGSRLLRSLLRKAPHLTHRFEHEPDSSDSDDPTHSIQEYSNRQLTIEQHGAAIEQLFDDLLIDLGEGLTDDRVIRTALQKIGRTHASHAITLNNDVWREFKRFTMETVKALQFKDEVERQETFDVWTRFISMIIAETKMGQWKQNRREFSISLSIDSNGMHHHTAV